MNGDKPAYPFAFDEMDVNRTSFGLTRRELFAAMAMQGLLTNYGLTADLREVSNSAARYADSLIAELDKDD